MAQGLHSAAEGWQENGLGAVAVIGAGGVARAVCYALGQGGAREIRLYDPVPGKAGEVAAVMRVAFSQTSGICFENESRVFVC